MNLTDHMHHAVADVAADHSSLIDTARKRGLGMRRRRQALSTFGAAAAVVAIAGGVMALQPHAAKAPADGPSVASAPTSVAPSGKTIPLTGRTTAAALKAAVDEVADGAFSDLTGQDPYRDPNGVADSNDTFAELRLTPPGEGLGVIGVNVQGLSRMFGKSRTFTCADGQGDSPTGPTNFMLDCHTKVLPNGDTIRTYRDALDKGTRLVAEYLSPSRDLRVVASATDGIDLPSNQWDKTRDGAVLTTEQLVKVVSQPWWGWQVPAAYDGKDLDYTDIPTSAVATEAAKKG